MDSGLEDQGWSAERGRCPIAIGDFDGDGLLDIVLANQVHHRVTVLLAQPNGSWRPGGSYPAESPARGKLRVGSKRDLVRLLS